MEKWEGEVIKEGNVGVIQDSVAVGEHMFAMTSTHTPTCLLLGFLSSRV